MIDGGDLAEIRSIPLFAGIPDDILATIGNCLKRRQYSAGANIMNVEAPGETVYVILSGTLKIRVDCIDGGEAIIALLGRGEVVGELSVIDSTGRSADVIAIEPSVLLWMDRTNFDKILNVAAVARNMLLILTKRVRLSTEQIQALCTLDVYGKVARQLLVFADQYGEETEAGVVIPVRLTQGDVASMVGASRERVNQVFVNLRRKGLLASDNNFRITLKNTEKLREIVRQR